MNMEMDSRTRLHRFEFDDWFPLNIIEMEGEIEPEDMSGEVRLTGTILVLKKSLPRNRLVNLPQSMRKRK